MNNASAENEKLCCPYIGEIVNCDTLSYGRAFDKNGNYKTGKISQVSWREGEIYAWDCLKCLTSAIQEDLHECNLEKAKVHTKKLICLFKRADGLREKWHNELKSNGYRLCINGHLPPEGYDKLYPYKR